MIQEIKIMLKNGKQYIPDIRKAVIPKPFRGRPEISTNETDEEKIAGICPFNAMSISPLQIDLGKCGFCGECALRFPEKISFTNDHKISTNKRENLIIKAGQTDRILFDRSFRRKEISEIFKKSLKLRQVSAAGDNSAEFELNACGNANFDMGRFGFEFVASPRHADGILVTGPISENMAEALEIALIAVPEPKVFILCGTDAISGGLFAESKALNRKLLEKVKPDLYIPGNPSHPLTVINGLLDLVC